MPDVKIRQSVWKDLIAAAEKQQRKPEAVANQALQDYLRRIADEELISRSVAAAQRSKFKAAHSGG